MLGMTHETTLLLHSFSLCSSEKKLAENEEMVTVMLLIFIVFSLICLMLFIHFIFLLFVYHTIVKVVKQGSPELCGKILCDPTLIRN